MGPSPAPGCDELKDLFASDHPYVRGTLTIADSKYSFFAVAYSFRRGVDPVTQRLFLVIKPLGDKDTTHCEVILKMPLSKELNRKKRINCSQPVVIYIDQLKSLNTGHIDNDITRTILGWKDSIPEVERPALERAMRALNFNE